MIPSRVKRVSETMKEVLSEIIQLNLKDPHVGFVTVTGVEMTPDLKQAKVWVSVMGDEEEERNTLKALKHAKGFLKAEVAKRVRLRYMPELTFMVDETVRTSMRIEGILKEIIPEQGDEDEGGS
jgi:ribosome-binding factor A